ncbi:MAG TPA: hypothetical protein VGR74_16555 [Actinomycetota bacterium]|nr:hypothetical protein [Actinomycetota bacterium]
MHPDQVAHEVSGWLKRRLPAGWFAGPPEVAVDGEEILVVGALPDADGDPLPRAEQFREDTREQRMRLAAELQRRWRRKVSWGVDCGGERLLFTTLSMPVMTRLRLAERRVLDTLIDAGVARSRSDALAWCVRLVGHHQGEWIRELQAALVAVRKVRAQGPDP